MGMLPPLESLLVDEVALGTRCKGCNIVSSHSPSCNPGLVNPGSGVVAFLLVLLIASSVLFCELSLLAPMEPGVDNIRLSSR
jgi:hypothetical protein